MLRRLADVLKLVRWFHELLAVLPFVGLYFVISYFARKSGLECDLSGLNFFFLCVCVQLLIAAGCILNDIMDRHIDLINKPQTHTVGRTISLRGAKQLFVAVTILIALLSSYISIYVFSEWAYISASVYFLSVLYDVYLKRSPLFGNILIAVLASFIPLVLFFFAGECIAALRNEKITVLIFLYSFFPFLVIVARELSLDISDMKGDEADGCRTLPIVIGVSKSRAVVVALIILIIILSIITSFFYPYLLVTFLLTNMLLIVYLVKFRQAKTRIGYIRAGRFLWFTMIIGLVGFTVATIYS
jgi:4-hydroxybenzoate polyprenyltransferase